MPDKSHRANMTYSKKKGVGAPRTRGDHSAERWLRGAERNTMASADVYTATTGLTGGIRLFFRSMSVA